MIELLPGELAYLRVIAMRFYSECAAAGLDPDDLAQETAIHVLDKPALPRRESDRRRFLLRVMANLLHDRRDAARALKRGGGRLCSLEELLDGMAEATVRLENLMRSSGPGPRTVAERREARAHITAALESLPVRQRAAVTLHLVHEFTLEETANAMKSTEGQVRGLVQRGREDLRVRLRDLMGEP